MEQFYDLIVNKFLAATGEYMESLDWSYMISLIICMWVLSWLHPKTIISLGKKKVYIPESWRVIVVALVLALISFYFNGENTKAAVKVHFQSMLASMVLYKLALSRAAEWVKEHFPAKKKTE